MKIKLKRDDLFSLLQALQNCEEVTFNTHLERKICGAITKEFVLKLAKKAVELTPKISITIDDQTMHTLNFVMPQLISEDAYSLMVVRDIHQQINKACLSI